VWSVDAADPNSPGWIDGALAESCDGRLYVGGIKGWFTFDASTGAFKWKYTTVSPPSQGAINSSPVIAIDGTMYGVDYACNAVALDPAGNPIWSKQLCNQLGGSSPALANGVLYVVLPDGSLYAIDAATGNQKWSRPVNNGAGYQFIPGPVVDGNGRVYFNSNDGNVHAFDAAGNPLWTLPASGTVNTNAYWAGSMAIAADGTLYVPGNDGVLYAFK
jgi:outer membrane protein assembly factor BamB